MKKLLALTTATALFGSALYAGGPVVIEDEGAPVVVEEKPASSGGWLVPALVLVVIGLAISSSDNETQGSTW